MKIISIIIPIYNTEKYLEKCLESILKQTYKNLQVLMIDDGSRDRSADICKRFCQQDSRFEYIYQDNSGASSARNNGLRHAKGDYIGFCDSDDWIDLNMYENLINIAEQERADIVICSYNKEKENEIPQLISNEKKGDLIKFTTVEALKELHITTTFTGFMVTKLFKKELFEGISFNEEITITEDALVCIDLFEKANNIVYQSVPYYHYRMREDSAMKCTFNESFWSVQEASRLMVEHMLTISPTDVIYPQSRLIRYNLCIADKLYKVGKLDVVSYERIKAEIQKNDSQKARELIVNKELKKILDIFLESMEDYLRYMRDSNFTW